MAPTVQVPSQVPRTPSVPSTGAQPSQSSSLSKRVQAIVSNESALEGVSRSSLEYLSTIIGDNSISTRRNLKSILENELVSLHGQFFEEYESKVTHYLESKLTELERLEVHMTDSIDKLSVNRENIGAVIERSALSKAETEWIHKRLAILSRMQESFMVNLSAADAVVASGDFPALLSFIEEVEEKRSNCKNLLRAIPNASVALDSLNQSQELLEVLYDKVYVRVVRDTVPRDVLKRSLSFLYQRPLYFHQSLQGVCNTRCDVLSGQFLQVLTKEGLELNAFDSVKFLSDMLSWLMNACISELEWIDSVVIGLDPWPPAPALPKPEYMDTSVSGVLEMIQSRFTNIVKSTFSILDLFKLSKIISFYLGKMTALTGPSTCTALRGMHHSAWSAFLFQWEQRVQSERTSAMFQTPKDLGPLPFVTETVYLLDSILSIYAADDGYEGTGDGEFFTVLSTGIDPLVQLCVQVAAQCALSNTEAPVFLLNCLSSLQAPLRRYAFTERTVTNLAALIDDQMGLLVAASTTAVLKKVGLLDKVSALRKAKEAAGDVHIESIPELHPIALSSCFKGFYSMLFTQGISVASHVDLLVTRELRSEARDAIGRSVADAYEELFTAAAPLGIATHTPDQVRALLDI